MTSDRGDPRNTDSLVSWLVTAWYEDMFDRSGPIHVGPETYRLATESQYAALGEAAYTHDAPLILVRETDGLMFEVELDATAWNTTAAERQEKRDLHRKMRERAERAGLLRSRAADRGLTMNVATNGIKAMIRRELWLDGCTPRDLAGYLGADCEHVTGVLAGRVDGSRDLLARMAGAVGIPLDLNPR